MKGLKKHWRLAIVILVVLVLIRWRYIHNELEQDNYLEYAQALVTGQWGELAFSDTRLMPGLPILIGGVNLVVNNWQMSGYVVLIISLIYCYCWWYWLTKSEYSVIALVFPPIMLKQASIMATEYVVLALMLMTVWLFKEKKYLWAGLVAGIAVWVRLIGGVLGVGIILWWLWRKKWRQMGQVFLAFILPILMLLWFNGRVFGWGDWGRQWWLTPSVSRMKVGVVQLVKDIPRAWSWGWRRQVYSGAAYLAVLYLWLRWAYRPSKRREWQKWLRLNVWLVLGFVFSLGPTPFLEEFPRFLVPAFGLLWPLIFEVLEREWVFWGGLLVSVLVVAL